jgi:hypothetical protein
MFAPEITDGTIKVVLQDWKLPRVDLWAAFPARPIATTKAGSIQFAQEVMRLPGGAATRLSHRRLQVAALEGYLLHLPRSRLWSEAAPSRPAWHG